MPSKSALEKLIEQQRKAAAAQQRQAELQRKAAEKAAKERQRQEELERKAAEKSAQQRYFEERQQEADKLNSKVEKHIEALQTILELKLKKSSSFNNLFTQLIQRSPSIPPNPILASPAPPPIPPNREAFEARLPKAGLAEKAIGIGRAKRQESYEEIREAYQKAVQDYQIKTQEREKSIERDKAFYANKVQERQQAIQELEAQLQAKKRELVEQYFQLVLEESEYPEGFPAKQSRLSYNPETCELVLEYDLPQYDPIIPAFKGYKYIKASDKIEGIALSQTDERKMQELYEEVIAAVALGTLHELFAADQMDALAIVTFNGMANTVDKATGKDIRPCLVSVQTSKEDFLKLNLARVDKKACLKHLKAQTSPSSKELVPVKPLVDLVTTDSRFVKEANVLSQLDSRLNLLTMSPGDFEHLIANLFTSMGFKTGTTRLSNDGGVDVIAFDERPLMGGKIIIQAKRYRNTVDVESVRALYGVMQDEGATKGILVTTSSFGKASREFVVGKPIELVDGNALLYYLEQQGYKAKIELSKK